MKYQLLTIGILTLVLCAMVPTAAMAAPGHAAQEKSTINGQVYSLKENKRLEFVFGKEIGTISIDKMSLAWTLTKTKQTELTAGEHKLGITKSGKPVTVITVISPVTVDANGYITTTTGTSFASIDTITTNLANGGRFVVL